MGQCPSRICERAGLCGECVERETEKKKGKDNSEDPCCCYCFCCNPGPLRFQNTARTSTTIHTTRSIVKHLYLFLSFFLRMLTSCIDQRPQLIGFVFRSGTGFYSSVARLSTSSSTAPRSLAHDTPLGTLSRFQLPGLVVSLLFLLSLDLPSPPFKKGTLVVVVLLLLILFLTTVLPFGMPLSSLHVDDSDVLRYPSPSESFCSRLSS